MSNKVDTMTAKKMKKAGEITRSIALSATLFSLAISQQAFAQPNNVEKGVEVVAPVIKVDQANPYKMIEEVAGITFKRFADQQQDIRKNPNLLKDIVREELMPYINYQYSAFKVIGQQLKKTTKQERSDFVPVFREYLVTSYAQVFTLYDNQQVMFFPGKDFSKQNIVAVNTRVIMPGRDDIDVAFKVRRNKKDNSWQAFDMIAEGVSLLDSKHAELASIIRQKGLPYVTELLKKKSERNIVFKDQGANNSTVANSTNSEG